VDRVAVGQVFLRLARFDLDFHLSVVIPSMLHSHSVLSVAGTLLPLVTAGRTVVHLWREAVQKRVTVFGLLNLHDGSTSILRNVVNCLPLCTA
jgi:hypothetical protein